jgi:hypothetical protein
VEGSKPSEDPDDSYGPQQARPGGRFSWGSPGAEAAAEVGPGPGPGVWPWPEVGMKVAARLGGTPARPERGVAALGAASSMAGKGEPDVWRAPRARGRISRGEEGGISQEGPRTTRAGRRKKTAVKLGECLSRWLHLSGNDKCFHNYDKSSELAFPRRSRGRGGTAWRPGISGVPEVAVEKGRGQRGCAGPALTLAAA